jgi:hypothetical protein
MHPGRISFFVTNFADEIGGKVHVAVLPAQLRGDLLGPGVDAAIDFRIEGLAREDVFMHGFFVGLLFSDGLCRFHGVLTCVQCKDDPTGREVQVASGCCKSPDALLHLRSRGATLLGPGDSLMFVPSLPAEPRLADEFNGDVRFTE